MHDVIEACQEFLRTLAEKIKEDFPSASLRGLPLDAEKNNLIEKLKKDTGLSATQFANIVNTKIIPIVPSGEFIDKNEKLFHDVDKYRLVLELQDKADNKNKFRQMFVNNIYILGKNIDPQTASFINEVQKQLFKTNDLKFFDREKPAEPEAQPQLRAKRR